MTTAEVVAKALREDWHIDGSAMPDHTADLLADLVEIGERMSYGEASDTDYYGWDEKLAALALIVDPDSKEVGE